MERYTNSGEALASPERTICHRFLFSSPVIPSLHRIRSPQPGYSTAAEMRGEALSLRWTSFAGHSITRRVPVPASPSRAAPPPSPLPTAPLCPASSLQQQSPRPVSPRPPLAPRARVAPAQQPLTPPPFLRRRYSPRG